MDLRFIKLRICGADLLLVDDLKAALPRARLPAIASVLLDRRRGVGAQRLVIVSRPETELWLGVLDGSGTPLSTLGDAALCASRYLLDSGLVGADSLRFRGPWGELGVDVLDGSSLGIAVGPLLSLPGRERLDPALAAELRSDIEWKGVHYEALPVALAARAPRKGEAGEGARPTGPEAVALFFQGGAGDFGARVRGGRRGKKPPPALPIRVIGPAELLVGPPRDPRLDSVSQAAMALGASSLLGHAEEEGLVRSADGALWARRNAQGGLYVAGRPEYVFRGEFTLEP